MVFIEIDSVVNDVQPVGLDVEKPLDVFLCLAGNSNNGIGHFERGAFEPDRKIIAAGKLFAFPRAKRLERMNRDDKRQPVIQFRQNPAKVAVPGVAMHNRGIDAGGVKIRATTNRAKNRLQRFRTRKFTRVQLKAGDLEISLLRILIAKTADLDRHRFRKLA